jgi:CRP/FNR family transcriptional regulator, cyclic AMP receptor protein
MESRQESGRNRNDAGAEPQASSLRGLLQGMPALWAAIDRVAVLSRLAPGAVLFRKDDEASSFYLVEQGEIEISVTSHDGRKLSLEILTPPALFGEIGLFAGRRTADAAALTPVLLRCVRRADLLAHIRTDPDLSLALIDLLCARLKSVSDKLEERTFHPLTVRLARRLTHLLDTFGVGTETIHLSQADLADFAGATREAVANTLGVWRRQGWIEVARGAIYVRNRAALDRLAADGAE